jgi:protein-S-isoprenylcysteine O-methyltransferase Ste14
VRQPVTLDPFVSRAIDWGFGLSAVGWAVRMVAAHPLSLVSCTIAALNLSAGLLFLFRRRASAFASWRDCGLCLGSLLMSGVALKLAPPMAEWPLIAELTFAIAGAAAVGSLLALGSSFGFFPALRGLVERGPFQFIRHPIYACEMLMVMACSLAAGTLLGWWPAVVALIFVVVRIRIEERLLLTTEGYDDYRHRVRWRMLPLVW